MVDLDKLRQEKADISYASVQMLKSFELLKAIEIAWTQYLEGMLDEAPTRLLNRDELRRLPYANINDRVPGDLHAELDSVQLSKDDINDLVQECVTSAYFAKAESIAEMMEQAQIWAGRIDEG